MIPVKALISYFDFDFWDTNKQHRRGLVPSLPTQFSTGPYCDILSRLHSDYDNGPQPSDDALKQCLIEKLTIRGQRPIYLILNALDECLDNSEVLSHQLLFLEPLHSGDTRNTRCGHLFVRNDVTSS